MSKKILIAGTRLTGDNMHLGTYYGWIYQIKRAQEKYNVVIMISDYQSLDNDWKCYSYIALNLKKYLKQFLPDVPIIIESEISGILELGFLIQNKFKNRYYRRVMPIRKKIEDEHLASFHMLIYPSMMLADIYALNATVMFDKPEGKFQHSEVINNLIKDMNYLYNINYPFMEIFNKQHINILSLDASGPMKRNRAEHGIIEINNIDEQYLFDTFCNCDGLVVKSIADSIQYPYSETELKDYEFLKKFSKKIVDDVNPSNGSPFLTEEAIKEKANFNVMKLIEIIKL